MTAPHPFGRYRLLERIGVGGMAEIFRATTEGPGGFEMEVCIKRILPHCSEDPEFVRMFVDEARVAARLRHANIVQIIDFNQVDGAYYIAMELVEGKDLRSLLKQLDLCNRRIGLARAAAITADLCRGLSYAHGRRYQGQPMNIVHRDISPHNVLLSYAGEVKITDFGIAKAATRNSKSITGLVKGKLAYMAPEQACGAQIDHRVDQFATGLVLFEMLAGRRAYVGNSDIEVLQQAMRGQLPSIRALGVDLPPALAAVVERATALRPADRFPDMATMEQELRRFLVEIAAAPDDLDIGAAVREQFGALRSERPRTELLPAVADLPPYDDEPAAEEGSSVWRETAGSATSSITGAAGLLPTALERAPTDPVAPQQPALPALTATGASSAVTLPPAVAPLTPATRPLPDAPSAPAALPRSLVLARPLALWGIGASALLLGLWWLWPATTVATVADAALAAVAEDAAVPTAATQPTAIATSSTTIADSSTLIADGSTASQPARPADRPSVRAPKTGRVVLLVTDSWAEVYLGNRKLGETPLDVEIPVGRRRLRLYNSDTKVEKWVAVEVKPGAVAQIATTLGPAAKSSR